MRFVFGTVLRLVGIVLQVVLMLVGLVLVLALCLLGMALMPVFLPLLFVFERGFGLVQQTYPALLGWALRQRLLIIGSALAALLVCWYKLLPDLGTELIPQVHQAEFNLDLRLPVGTPLEETAEIVRQIEGIAGEQPQVARDGDDRGHRPVGEFLGRRRRAHRPSNNPHAGGIQRRARGRVDPASAGRG